MSKVTDVRAAVREVVATALAKVPREELIAAMVFWGIDHDAEAIARAMQEALPDVPTIGCSTDGEITSGGLTVDSICLFVIASRHVTARASVARPLSADSAEAGRTIARALETATSRVLLILPDGLTGNGSAIIGGALEVLGSKFVIGGGTAGDRGRFTKTFQLCNGKAYTDSVVGLMLSSPQPLEVGYGVMSGWRPIGIAKTVTKAEGNVVYRIGEETALSVYSTFLGEKASQLPAIGVEYPFGLVDRSGQVDERGIRLEEEYILLRAPMTVNRETGAVGFAAEIPQGAQIKMTMAKLSDVIQGSRVAAERALRRLTGRPDVVLFFSCMARKVALGRRTGEEIEVAQKVFGDGVPMAGFYTYGEIANCGESAPICRFHNETATFLALREP